MSRGNSRLLMKGLVKMKKLRYLEVNFATYGLGNILKFDEASQYFTNSLKYLKCTYYPFLYLAKTFQANNLVGLEMKWSRMVQLWEEGEKKVCKKLKFLSLSVSNLTTFDFTITPNLESLSLNYSFYLQELRMTASCQNLNYLHIGHSKLITFDLGLTPNLETLSLLRCTQFVKLKVSVACPNLKFLDLNKLRLRSLDLELIPNLERLNLRDCDELVQINAPVGCLKNVVKFDLSGCLRFPKFVFDGGCKPKINSYSASLHLDGESLALCPLHPNSNLPKFQLKCHYEEYLPSSVGNIEKLISFGLCACTDFEKFSDVICSLRCLNKLELRGSIPEFPRDLHQLKNLEELHLSSTKMKHLPGSICMLKHLKSLKVSNGDILEKLPEDLGQLDSLEKLYVSSKKIEYLPDSICMLKHLKHLELDQCYLLEKLPKDLGELKCLEELHIVDSGIGRLSQSVLGLKGPRIVNTQSFKCSP